MQPVSNQNGVVSYLDNVASKAENDSAKKKGPVRAASKLLPVITVPAPVVSHLAPGIRWNDGVLHWGLND